MPRKSTLPPDAPVWLTEDRRIDEMTFCCSFLEAHPMKCVHGKLYTVDGLISDEAALKREIFMEICDWVKSGTARKVEDLLKAVRMMAFADEPHCIRTASMFQTVPGIWIIISVKKRNTAGTGWKSLITKRQERRTSG